MPKLLTDTMLSKFSVQGATPVTMEDMNRLMANMMEQMKEHVKLQRINESAANNLTNPATVSNLFSTYMWGGKFHMVPEGWKLPANNIKDIWNLWWFGHLDNKIQPYRFLKWTDLINNAQVVQLAKMKKVMNKIEEMGKEKQYIELEKKISDLSKEESIALFDQSFTALMEKLKPGSTIEAGRWGESSIATVYNLIDNKRKRITL
jgi:hypothetical protein